MKLYEVVSGNMPYTEDIYMGQGPTYDERAVCYVRASTKRKAIIAAVRQPNEDFSTWVSRCRSDGENPFIGVFATELDEGEFFQYPADWTSAEQEEDRAEFWASVIEPDQRRTQ